MLIANKRRVNSRGDEWSQFEKNKGLAKLKSNFTGLAISFFERFRTSRSFELFAKPFWGLNFKLGLAISKTKIASVSQR